MATLYKVMEWQNGAEVLRDGEISALVLLASARTARTRTLRATASIMSRDAIYIGWIPRESSRV